MSSSRTTQDVTTQILEAAINAETRPKIMFKTFLSQEQLQKFLHHMINEGLISEEGTRAFKTTEKGLALIKESKHDSPRKLHAVTS